jgi:Fur family transcriptional regulator, zinc uptake regulator
MKLSRAQCQTVLESHHLKVTEPRLMVLEFIGAQSGPSKAYDIIHGLTVNPPTVYRALASLTEAGIIHRIESLNAYVFCLHLDHDHSEGHEIFFTICDDCGRVDEIDHDLKTNLRAVLKARNFHAKRRIFEIHGACSSCA